MCLWVFVFTQHFFVHAQEGVAGSGARVPIPAKNPLIASGNVFSGAER